MRSWGLSERAGTGLMAGLLGLGSFLLVALTIPDYGVAWDEPYYFHAADLEIRWLAELWRALGEGRAAAQLRDEVIAAAWHWNPSFVPHPPLSRVLSGLSTAWLSGVVDPLVAARLHVAALFGTMVAVMCLWLAEVANRVTGLVAGLLVVVTPNLFGFAHFALTDLPLTALWFLATYAFWRGLHSWRWSLGAALLWGLALATKFPAFAIPIPLVLWAHLGQRRPYQNNVAAMMFVSPAVMVAANPYWWHQTLARVAEFVLVSSSRAFRPGTDFTIYFLGEYHRSSTIPWYYSTAMTALTIPEGILALALIGLVGCVGPGARGAAPRLWAASAGFVLALGVLPGAVLHDVTRLLLPALPFVVALAGWGFYRATEWLVAWSERRASLRAIRDLRVKETGAVCLLALFPPAATLLAYHPYEPSYFNRLIGGIRGAYAQGFEVTSGMEVFNPAFFAFLDRELPANAVVNGSFANFMLRFHQRQGRLRRDVRITDDPAFDYYILLNRPSAYRRDPGLGVWDPALFPEDRAFRALAPRLHATWSLHGVPLVWLFKPGRS